MKESRLAHAAFLCQSGSAEAVGAVAAQYADGGVENRCTRPLAGLAALPLGWHVPFISLTDQSVNDYRLGIRSAAPWRESQEKARSTKALAFFSTQGPCAMINLSKSHDSSFSSDRLASLRWTN